MPQIKILRLFYLCYFRLIFDTKKLFIEPKGLFFQHAHNEGENVEAGSIGLSQRN